QVTSVLTRVVAKLLLLPTLVAAAAILVKGYTQPGDGFSAGVVAGLGVVLQYLAFGREEAERIPVVRSAGVIAFAGLLISLLVMLAPLFLGDPILTHYPAPDAEVLVFGTLEILTAVLFDVGVFLLVFGFSVATVSMISRSISHEEEYAADMAASDTELDTEPDAEPEARP
ncbi:MAG TPA: MnhB domain-containing protein, partial [Rubrobacteraceae bacterium]|nr:MnhB domain-containing protein [Rubrobacteraceae bacterium]